MANEIAKYGGFAVKQTSQEAIVINVGWATVLLMVMIVAAIVIGFCCGMCVKRRITKNQLLKAIKDKLPKEVFVTGRGDCFHYVSKGECIDGYGRRVTEVAKKRVCKKCQEELELEIWEKAEGKAEGT